MNSPSCIKHAVVLIKCLSHTRIASKQVLHIYHRAWPLAALHLFHKIANSMDITLLSSPVKKSPWT